MGVPPLRTQRSLFQPPRIQDIVLCRERYRAQRRPRWVEADFKLEIRIETLGRSGWVSPSLSPLAADLLLVSDRMSRG